MMHGSQQHIYFNESINIGENQPSQYQDKFDDSVVDEIMGTQTNIDHIKQIKNQINYLVY